MCTSIFYQKELEESEKKFQSTQGRLEEFAALKKKLSNTEKTSKALEASKEVSIKYCVHMLYSVIYTTV